MKCVVTGGSGFLGNRLVRQLLAAGNDVTVFDNMSSGLSKNLEGLEQEKGFSFVRGDVTDINSLKAVLTPDTDRVYHLSAIVGVKQYCKDPLKVVDVNVIGTRNVLELALKNEIKILFTSTSEIFGKNPRLPWKEGDDRVLGSTTVDRWSYSTSKAMCEHMIFALSRNQGLPATILRYFNIYGPGQQPYFVISQSVYRVLRGEKPLLYDSGNQTRCFTYVDDAIEGTLRAADSKAGEGQALNIGNTTETTIRETIEMILKLTGSSLSWEDLDTATHYGERYEDIERRIPDASKARELLGWEAATDLRTGLQKIIDWTRQNTWWLNKG